MYRLEKTVLFWFAKDQHWVEIKHLTKSSRLENHITKYQCDLQRFKHNALVNLGLQISGSSKQQKLILVSIEVQHLHLHQVLLSILPFTP